MGLLAPASAVGPTLFSTHYNGDANGQGIEVYIDDSITPGNLRGLFWNFRRDDPDQYFNKVPRWRAFLAARGFGLVMHFLETNTYFINTPAGRLDAIFNKALGAAANSLGYPELAQIRSGAGAFPSSGAPPIK